ncbi:LRR receptor-like serine/threonine-protein kinase GSO2 [Grifola frondosa]|uniref:LRR receptor-like serine/threonine-protein kinase GSO2 n=1 Tax=Grifola frondosa TaxID=5627 RepID=A0A1C7LXX4_GRIFR|nr:LRR receptor-like serine/threonine-protein kinase GSO2 [Grifola frondosa]
MCGAHFPERASDISRGNWWSHGDAELAVSPTLFETNGPTAGALPSSFISLTSLSTLHLESTAISALPDSLFSSLNKVATLTLVRNTQMGAALPSSLSGLSLQNLVVNNQPLDNPLQTLASSASLQPSMKLIDLSSTSLNGTIPSTISAFSALTELHLDDNNLSAPLPSAFPPGLQALTLTNNTGLAGSVAQSSALCTLAALKDCDLRGSGLTSPSGGCGVCQFK